MDYGLLLWLWLLLDDDDDELYLRSDECCSDVFILGIQRSRISWILVVVYHSIRVFRSGLYAIEELICTADGHEGISVLFHVCHTSQGTSLQDVL